MKKYYNKILREIETSLNPFEIEAYFSIQLIEMHVMLILQGLADLKEYVQRNDFKNTDEEISFFKHQKPTVISKLIYYNILYKIGDKKIYGRKQIKKFLNKELSELKKFRRNNLDFYQYYRSNHTYRDKEYFLRNNNDIKSDPNDNHFWTGHTFSTSHDYKAAKILACDLLQKYIEKAL